MATERLEVGQVWEHKALARVMPPPFCLVVIDEVEVVKGDDYGPGYTNIVVRIPGHPHDESQSVTLHGWDEDYTLCLGKEADYVKADA